MNDRAEQFRRHLIRQARSEMRRCALQWRRQKICGEHGAAVDSLVNAVAWRNLSQPEPLEEAA